MANDFGGGFDWGSGFGGIDLSTITNGADSSAPLGDVSWGAQDMQPYTPTGNGSGVFFDTQTQNAIFGGLDKVLNYALLRDQQQMARTPTPMQMGALQMQATQQRNNNQLIYIGLALAAVILIVKS